MNPTKQEIKTWLKTYGHTREWLGEQCGGVSKRAVDNWLSSPREIPDASLALIGRLMEDDQKADIERLSKSHPTNQFFSVEVDIHRYRAYSKAALAAEMTLEDWVVDECDKAAKEYAELRNAQPEHQAKLKSIPNPDTPPKKLSAS